MTRYLLTVALIVCCPILAQAELRTIALDIHQTPDKHVRVTIYSEVQSEQMTDVSVSAAEAILKKATGWGSSVEVAIATDRSVDLSSYVSLLQAIAENSWLDLAMVKSRRGFGDQILRHYGITVGESVEKRDVKDEIQTTQRNDLGEGRTRGH